MDGNQDSPQTQLDASRSASDAAGPRRPKKRPKRRHRFFRWVIFLLLLLIGLLCAIRPFLPSMIRTYVNHQLDKSLIYEGKIGYITLHLWRGSYVIHDVRLVKKTAAVPVPLYSAKRVDFSIQWDALRHGKIVGQIEMDQPELNFVDAPTDSEAQTGSGGPWLQILRDLFPFKINKTTIKDASIHFRTFQSRQPVDVYLSHLDGDIDNLSNIRDETAPLITTITARGLAMDEGRFEFNMRLDPFSYNPHFHMAVRLLGLDVVRTNDLVRAYGQFQFRSGFFDLVMEAEARGGQIQGYVKPLFRQLSVFDLPQDLKYDKDPLQFFWQAILGVTTAVLKNQPRDQFATLVPFTGDASTPNIDLLTTLGNVIRNGFVRAYLPRLENDPASVEGLQFSPGTFADSTDTDSP